MKCYRPNCECDDIKKTYCIHRVTKEQYRLLRKIRENGCITCGDRTIKSKFNKIDTRLCLGCGTVAKGNKVVGYCLVNSRRAG